MRLIMAEDYERMSGMAALHIEEQLREKPDCTLGLATGSTPIGIYKALVWAYGNKRIDFARVTTVNLDEYAGLARDDEQSYYYYMDKHLFSHVNIDRARAYLPDGMEDDEEKVCRTYEGIIAAAGGVDLQLLGIGHNGHIGFNEPGDVFAKSTFRTALSEETIKANQRFFSRYEDVPKYAYTMGIGTIMDANRILLAVSGSDKAAIVREAFFGPVTPKVPASILQFHRNVVVVGDKEAFSLLEGF